MSTVTPTQDPAGPAPETRSRRPGRAFAAAFGLTIVAFVVSLAFGLGTGLTLGALFPGETGIAVLVPLFAAGQIGFLGVALLYVWRTGLDVPIRIPTLRDLGWIAGGVVVSLVAATVLSLVRVAFFPDTGSVIGDVGAPDASLFLYLAVLSLILVGPAEELLFRGAIQGRLRRSLSAVPAVVGASALFGLLHVLNFTGSIAGALAAAAVIGVVSLLWGYAYERTGNILVPAIIHGVYNCTLFALTYLALTLGAGI